MVDHDKIRKIRSDINQLLDEFSSSWPADKIKLVREEVGYGEYSDALQNLIAIAVTNRIEVSDKQYDKVRQLVSEMGIFSEVRRMILHIRNNEKVFPLKQVG